MYLRGFELTGPIAQLKNWIMKNNYPLDLLETLVYTTLNPLKNSDVRGIADRKNELYNLLKEENIKIKSAIAQQVFRLNDETKISCAVNNYHSVLMVLLDQAFKNQARVEDATLLDILDGVISGIDDLLYFIKSRFIIYLSLEVRAPLAYAKIIQKRLRLRLDIVTRKFRQHIKLLPVFNIIQLNLKTCFNFSEKKCPLKLRSIFYFKELMAELENLELSKEEEVYTKLDQLLIRMNFNCPLYLEHLQQKIRALIPCEGVKENKEEWLFHKRYFRQFYQRKEIVFRTNDADLKTQMDIWFSQRIYYLDKEMIPSLSRKDTCLPKQKSIIPQKLQSTLSVDQMALVLRAADETRVIMARSLSSVFKNIAPHLSTPQKENISFDSMRSKSYSAEVRDKEVVIQMMRQMIDKIKDY